MSLRIIGGQFKGRPLKTPKGPSTRPTQGMLREAVFNICQNSIEGAIFLDIYAGSGAMAFEAISRGASKAVLIEKNKVAIACIKENMKSLQIESQVKIMATDALSAVKRLEKKFDIIYIDPPYETPTAPLIELLIKDELLGPSAILFIEERDIKSKPPMFPNLFLKNSRRFGVAMLHQYQLIEDSEPH